MDIEKLNEDRRALEAQLRAAKTELRTTWTRPMANVQCRLLRLKREATELYILRAWLRGRLHLPDAERCREVAERRAPDYGVEAA